jgi:anti-sigma factor RsiW
MTDSPATDLSCRELVELVTAYFDGALPQSERARFEAHLDECPYCDTYLRQMRQTIRILGALTEDTISPDARDALLARFQDWKHGQSSGD